MDIAALQRRLITLGFNPGPVDGAFGRQTIEAVKKFQTARALKPDGIVGPKTLAALVPSLYAQTLAPGQTPPSTFVPPWLSEARRKRGLLEIRDRLTLMAWLRSDGKTLGDPSKLPWCGDFVETCLALTLPNECLPTNPYYATNWQQFGVPLMAGALGAVLVFKRPGGGHVGFYEGQDATHFHVLGGNQSDAITLARVARDRCIAIRWPKTVPLPTAGPIVMTAAGIPITTNEA